MEIWKDIEGFEGEFQVSNLGRIKSFNYHGQGKEGILKPKKHNKGYLQIQLMCGGKDRTFTIHRLVAKAFVPNPNNYPIVNHKDEDRQNNNADNLEWCNNSYNVLYSRRLHPIKHKHSAKVNQYDLNGNLIKTWDDARTVFNETGMSDWCILECCRGNRHTAYGYKWQYAN